MEPDKKFGSSFNKKPCSGSLRQPLLFMKHLNNLTILCKNKGLGFGAKATQSQGIWAGAGKESVTLTLLRVHLKYLFNNSHKLHGTLPLFMLFLK